MLLRKENVEQWNKLNDALTKKFGKSYSFVSGDQLRKILRENPDILKAITGQDDIQKNEPVIDEPITKVESISAIKKVSNKNTYSFTKGGPGSGCRGENCGRPSTGGSKEPVSTRETGEAEQARIDRARQEGKQVIDATGTGGKIPARGDLKTSQDVVEQTKQQGGMTINLKTAHQPTEGYVVSPYKNRERVVPADKFSPADVDKYVSDNRDALEQDDHYFGSWHNKEDGNIYMDTVVVKPSKEEAIKIAEENKQLAIYGIKEGKELKTPQAERKSRRDEMTGL